MREEHHVWIVDSIEEGIAAVEEDGARLVHVPVWLLPPDAAEGSVLRVRRSRSDAGEALVHVTLDAGATARGRGTGEDRSRPRNPADRGGDIVL